MSKSCDHNCSTCASKCEDANKTSCSDFNHIDRVIAVVSGKGGVGKTLVTSLLAVETARRSKHVALMDADITGPSIPKAFGLTKKAEGIDIGILPVKSSSDIEIMSINLLLEDETSPVVWRGPVISGTVNQFWTDVVWGTQDYMFIDMPPGTGDVPLTVFQSLPLDGVIIVTSPQDLVSLVVEKAVHMAELMNIPIIGLVENMSYFECDCGKRHRIFGESHAKATADKFSIPLLAQIPISPELVKLCDEGRIEDADTTVIKPVVDAIEKAPGRVKK